MATAAAATQPTPTTARRPRLSVAPPTSLREIVADAVRDSECADPAFIVDDVVSTLSADLLADAARHGLHSMATEAIRVERARVTAPSAGGPGKWERAKVHADVFGMRVCVGLDETGRGVWKFLRECDKADLKVVGDLKRNQAAGLIRSADQFSTLARKLHKGQTVADLDRETVEGVFDA